MACTGLGNRGITPDRAIATIVKGRSQLVDSGLSREIVRAIHLMEQFANLGNIVTCAMIALNSAFLLHANQSLPQEFYGRRI